jgi:hypothetical protein
VREKFVLKGGVLPAAFGNRRPTRDVDFAGRHIGNDEATVLALIKSVLAVQLSEDDGIEFAPDVATSEVIRDEDEYSGVRPMRLVIFTRCWNGPGGLEAPRRIIGRVPRNWASQQPKRRNRCARTTPACRPRW